MMWKMSGMKLYLASAGGSVFVLMAGLSLDSFSVVTKSLHPTFQAQVIEKAVHVSGELG